MTARHCKKGHTKVLTASGYWKCYECQKIRHESPEWKRRQQVRRSSDEFKITRNTRLRERYVTDPQYKAALKAVEIARYRLRVIGAVEVFTAEEVYERDEYLCQGCGKRCNPFVSCYHNDYPTLDHIVPLSKGGTHSRANAQTLCGRCNRSKGNRDMAEWLEKGAR